MKSIKFFLLPSLLLATAALQAQDEQAEQPEWQPPQPAKWLNMSSAGLTMGFAKDWIGQEDAYFIMGYSPDKAISILAKVSEFHTVPEVVANIQEVANSFCDGLVLTDPQESREVNGLTLLSTGGTGTLKDDTKAPILIAVDILETPVDGDDAIVVVLTYGTEEGMEQHFGDILMALESFKRSE
ncbi:MAG: hypothetical protein HY842_11005 [Bacteroidetes bacterium]|nr:hypothetical protein [Bacteroidota bacterium]